MQAGRSPSLAAALPLATPGLAVSPTGRGAALRCHPKGEEEIMAAPKFIEIDGKRFDVYSAYPPARRAREDKQRN